MLGSRASRLGLGVQALNFCLVPGVVRVEDDVLQGRSVKGSRLHVAPHQASLGFGVHSVACFRL